MSNTLGYSTLAITGFTGLISNRFNQHVVIDQLAALKDLCCSEKAVKLSNGGDYVVKYPLIADQGEIAVAIKVFKPQSWWKDKYDHKNKSKAERSFHAACFLQDNGINTPVPIAWLERWDGTRLMESYYLCIFEPGTSFRDALSDIYYNQRNNAPLIDLLHIVAPAIRAMHDAGFMHGDMGNQNILLPRSETGAWLQPQFIDLNRAKYSSEPLTIKQRAFDLARIALPGAYLKIFKTIYNNHQDFPADFESLEQKARKRFWGHRRSVKWRHPIRHWKNKKRAASKPVYPPIQDIWLWDEKSAQPMIVPSRQEKHAYRKWRYLFSMVWQGVCAAPGIYRRYQQLLTQSYTTPIEMKGRIGIALHPHPDYTETELQLLEQLGNPPVLIRFCHHETATEWNRTIALVKQLRSKGLEVMLAVLQDRQALLQPDSWKQFLTLIIESLGDQVAHIEITHASNRLKWGIWSSDEYRQLMMPALELQQRFPHIRLVGPACIDFEYLPVIAALDTHPKTQPLAALSHLLYVDRRGAPEATQGRQFSTLEKSALLKALAQWSDRCSDKVIVSEVNWPVKHAGIWSPIGCPYETPKWRRDEPGENDDDYANYMLRYYLITLCSGHIEQVFWWRLSAHGYGLVDDRNNFMPRTAFYALAQLLRLIGTARFVRKLDTESNVYALEFDAEERKITVAWRSDNNTSVIPASINYEKIIDRDGKELTTASISGAPIYLLGESTAMR
ncbi:hypothetical protein CBP51_14875 [Cellvibrio mixtus]|uniref:Protein kinase domain-containing protein n=1 Tax=Cellvibrio mixtus TaxID=39650 RepID=A0A266Q3M9_9GAMM|nr:lipopolysaccharide kinase InaA family protein [Cellvibrio mixtus]OZY84484.1 hypothetical protein CBP51_14875 [Cellvibrio mixtus]